MVSQLDIRSYLAGTPQRPPPRPPPAGRRVRKPRARKIIRSPSPSDVVLPFRQTTLSFPSARRPLLHTTLPFRQTTSSFSSASRSLLHTALPFPGADIQAHSAPISTSGSSTSQDLSCKLYKPNYSANSHTSSSNHDKIMNPYLPKSGWRTDFGLSSPMDSAPLSSHSPVDMDVDVPKTVVIDHQTQYESFTDDLGHEHTLIRVGPQPWPKRDLLFCVDRQDATDFIYNRMRNAIEAKDLKAGSTTANQVEHDTRQIAAFLTNRLVDTPNGTIARHCDYTGRLMSWIYGPMSRSVEGIYTVANGPHWGYHVYPNVAHVMLAVNMFKKNHPALVVPLCAVWMNTMEDNDMDDDAKDAILYWTSNAMNNIFFAAEACGQHRYRVAQIDMWKSWPFEKRKAIFDFIRTRELNDYGREMISGLNSRDVFRMRTTMIVSNIQDMPPLGRLEMLQLERIAAKFDLTVKEFRFYFTIKGPDSRLVFYPWHVTSQQQAIDSGWNWGTTLELGCAMLKTMRAYCNKNAEEAGYGEAGIDVMKFNEWLCTYFCHKVAQAKRQYSHLSPKQIRMRILDRWKLPIYPWQEHAWKASLCKGPDHGIAMKLGFLPHNQDDYDPTVHIDLCLCTVEIDTVSTNFTMFNWNTADWDSTRDLIRSVPLSHPFWRCHPDLGKQLWFGQVDLDLEPKYPGRAFDMELLPAEIWLSHAPFPDIHSCKHCSDSYINVGALVWHCQQAHSKSSLLLNLPSAYLENAQSGPMDFGTFFCPRCDDNGPALTSWPQFEQHILEHHNESEEVPLTCDECDRNYPSFLQFMRHKHKCHSKPVKCNECQKELATNFNLSYHISHLHSDQYKPYICGQCGNRYKEHRSLTNHMAMHDLNRQFVCERCDYRFSSKHLLQQHHRRKHPTTEFPFPCTFTLSGCKRAFRSNEARQTHENSKHRHIKEVCRICFKEETSKAKLRLHMKKMHPGVPYKRTI